MEGSEGRGGARWTEEERVGRNGERGRAHGRDQSGREKEAEPVTGHFRPTF